MEVMEEIAHLVSAKAGLGNAINKIVIRER
jgi:hypothetical protein